MSPRFRALRWSLAAGAAVAGWLVLAGLVALARDAPRVVAVIGPPAHGLRVLQAAGQPVVDVGPWAVTTRVTGPAEVKRLYAAGAPLVVEGRAGCGAWGRR